MTATDGNSNLSVTIALTCEENIVETKTQNIKSIFNFAPNNEIYGRCVLSLADVTGYYNKETVNVAYMSILSFVLPKSVSVVPPGSKYDIQVDGTSVTSSVSVTCWKMSSWWNLHGNRSVRCQDSNITSSRILRYI